MNDMRNQIVSALEDNHVGEMNRERLDIDAAADAILTLIPGSIKPLLWYRLNSTGDRNVHEAKGLLARYTAWPDGRWRLYGHNVGGKSPKGNLAGAQEDAYAYEQAAIMSRFNLGEPQ
jgi:hypothetical protein